MFSSLLKGHSCRLENMINATVERIIFGEGVVAVLVQQWKFLRPRKESNIRPPFREL